MDDDDLTSPEGRLRAARAAAGYGSAAEFAKKVGIAPVSYRAYETGQNGYHKHALRFGELLGVESAWLQGEPMAQ